ARGSEQPPFAPEAERAEIAALPIEAWPDLLIEVLQMLGVGKDCAPQKQRQRRAVRGIERQMEPFFRTDAAQGQHEAAVCMLSWESSAAAHPRQQPGPSQGVAGTPEWDTNPAAGERL